MARCERADPALERHASGAGRGVDGTESAHDAEAFDTFGDLRPTRERMRCSAGAPDHAEAVDRKMLRKLEDIRGPIAQRAAPLEVGQPEDAPFPRGGRSPGEVPVVRGRLSVGRVSAVSADTAAGSGPGLPGEVRSEDGSLARFRSLPPRQSRRPSRRTCPCAPG